MANGNGNKPLIAKGWFHMMIWSFMMMGIIVASFITGNPVPPASVTIYGLVLGCYAGSGAVASLSNSKSKANVSLKK